MDVVPPGASAPLVKPRSINDVPVLALTLWSKRYSGFELRRVAAELEDPSAPIRLERKHCGWRSYCGLAAPRR